MNSTAGSDPRIIIHKSKRKAIAITAAGLLLALAGGVVLQYLQDDLLGWCLIIAAIFVLILGVGSIFDRKPQLILTAQGITEPFVIREEIGWDAILRADDFFFRGQYFVRILLDRDYKPDSIRPAWFWRLDRIYGNEGLRALYIRASNLELNSKQLTTLIVRMAKADPVSRAGLIGKWTKQ